MTKFSDSKAADSTKRGLNLNLFRNSYLCPTDGTAFTQESFTSDGLSKCPTCNASVKPSKSEAVS